MNGRVHVIGAATSAGAHGAGQEQAPATFRRYGVLGGVAAGQLGLRAPFYLGAGTMAVLAVVLAPVLTTEALDRATGRAPRPPRDMSAPERGASR
jgi:hypothetical protein